MGRNAQRVDRITREAGKLVEQAAELRRSMPPAWKFRARRDAERQYSELMERATELAARAAAIPLDPRR